MRILVAEDDYASTKLLLWILEEEGHEVLALPDGQRALERFQADPTPIVISDWMMPEMDGLTLCSQIRALPLRSYTHFILLTAKTGQENYRTAMDAGVDDFLSKPVDQEELLIRLRVAERIIKQRWEAEAKILSLARFPQDNPNPVIEVDGKARIRYANRACEPLLEQWRLKLDQKVPPQLARLLTATHHDQVQETELACGDQVYSFAVTSNHGADDGDRTYIYGHNITARKQAEEQLLEMKNQAVEAALHDQLTGLPNRVLFRDRLAQGMARSQRRGSCMGLIMADLDNFKAINDSQGHLTGDAVLALVGNTLKDALRSSDTVCRWGGDELMLLVPDLPSRDRMPAICDRLIDALNAAIAQSVIDVPVTLSMGYSVYPHDGHDPDLLVQQADYALYEAKAEGRNTWRPFEGFPEGREIKGLAQLYLRLMDAVARKRIVAFYQPVIDASTRRIVGMEALARWHDEKEGWIAPDRFIPLAEERGLICALGEQVAEQGLRQLQHARQLGAPISVSLNLSKLQLLDPGFQPWLLTTLKELDIRPMDVVLEVTERQSFLTHELCRRHLEQLSLRGFRLSLDDFGTGYASLDVVGEMPFHELKIPRALVRKVDTASGRRLVQAIVEMARTLDLTVVAEGVETAATADSLAEIGVHKLQGYHFYRPLSEGDLAEVLRKAAAESNVLPFTHAA